MKNIIIIVLFIFPLSVNCSTLPIDYFAKQSQFSSIKLSPDGKHIAAIVPKGNTSNLVVINRKSMKSIIAYGFGNLEYVGSFYWVNNQRLIYTKSYQESYQEKKVSRGEIYAANIDGSKRLQLFGYTATKSKIKSKRAMRAFGKIMHLLPNDPDHILISAKKWDNDYDTPFILYKVNINNQKRSLISKTPLGNIKLILDGNGAPVIASGKDREGKSHKYLYLNKTWQELDKKDPLNKYSLLSVNSDASKLYLKRSIKSHTEGLYEYDFKNKKISLLFNHPVVDINSFFREPGTRTIIGVTTMLEGIEYHYLEDTDFSKTHQQLVTAFPDHLVSISANSLKDNELIIKIRSDKNPGDYYLYNKSKNTLNYLLSSRQWLHPDKMMPRKAISFQSRDNQTIYGYLTLPENNKKPYPLIVDVHGGPYGVKDSWLFNTDAQMFANQGFAVIQINFRGSGGYGKKYKEVAYQKRSTLIQYDIIDGTKWALNLDEIDNQKVCIVGGSFGGYSALMAPLIEPDLYKCAIPRYGPYDLVYQMTHADYMGKDSLSVGAKKKYGKTEAIWREQSPITYIDNLKTPLLIVTGGKDERVPPESAFRLKRVLDQRNIHYQWLYKDNEGHGFYNPENKAELYEKSLAFIKKHMEH